MKSNALSSLRRYFLSARQWYFGTSERALEQAYDAALKIKKIEDDYFGGSKISLDADYGDSVSAYFQAELKKYLGIAKFRLMEFRASNSFVNVSKPGSRPQETTTKILPKESATYSEEYTLDNNQYSSEVAAESKSVAILEKLKFVDSILTKYKAEQAPLAPPENVVGESKLKKYNYVSEIPDGDENSIFRKSGFIPRTIFRTVNKVKQDLDSSPGSEEEAVKKFRRSKTRTKAAVRFLLLLIIVPLLTQQISKTFIFNPLFDYFHASEEQVEISVDSEAGERVLTELGRFKEKIEFQRLIGQLPDLSSKELEEKVKEKAVELAEEYSWVSTEPVKNILSDGLSLGAFAIIVATGRREIATLKSFLDEVVYGLSDSAKAFIIILFTDVFVGFHSPHGWRVIVDGGLRHFGLPENEDFVDMFIATFPVMLDTVFKYWIFRYLNQISPSAVATYKNMNE